MYDHLKGTGSYGFGISIEDLKEPRFFFIYHKIILLICYNIDNNICYLIGMQLSNG